MRSLKSTWWNLEASHTLRKFVRMIELELFLYAIKVRNLQWTLVDQSIFRHVPRICVSQGVNQNLV